MASEPTSRERTDGTPPPLVERLLSGSEGAHEFSRLVIALLRAYAAHAGFQLHSAGGQLIAYGVPDLDGPVDFRILASAQHEGLPYLDSVLRRLGLLDRKTQGAPSSTHRTHVVLIAPVDLTLSERAWVQTRSITPGFAVHSHEGTDFRQITARYRDKVALVHRQVRLLGFPPEILREQDARSDIFLRELFVPIEFMPIEGGTARKRMPELLGQERPVVVLGDPGMGKSTVLAFLALVIAGAAVLPGLGPVPPSFLPLLIPLRDYVHAQQQDPSLGFLDYLALRAHTDLSLPGASPTFFEAALRMGEVVLLFDGLDEVASATARHRISKAIVTFQEEYPQCRIWVTARIHGYTADIALPTTTFEHVRIEPLEDAQVDDFLGRWYAIQIPNNSRECAERKDSLRRAIFRTPSVRRLAGNPLLLTLMAFIHRILGNLPEDRCELYGRCVDMLLRSWQEAKRTLDPEELHPFERLGLRPHVQKEYLAYLALHIQERNQGEEGEQARGLFPRDVTLAALTQRHFSRAQRERPAITQAEAEEEMHAFLDYIGERTGLLVERGGGQLSFLHLSFQEYLAAWVFTCDPGAAEHDASAFFVRHLDDPAWTEVLLLRLYIVLREQGGGGERAFDAIVSAVFRELDRRRPTLGWLLLCKALRDRLAFRARDRDEILTRVLEHWQEAPRFGERWYEALDEVRIFGEESTSLALRHLLADFQRKAPPPQAIASLHLEAQLYEVPEDAPARFAWRPDLPELLPDLVAFLDEPGFACLLAERATVDDWDIALSALDSPALYRRTIGWATGAVPCPVRADAPLLAALRLLQRKCADEARSRAVFADRYTQSDAATLFRHPGRVVLEHRFGRIEAPLGAFVVPGEGSSATAPAMPDRRLLMGGFLRYRVLEKIKPPSSIESPLSRWAASHVSRLFWSHSMALGDGLGLRLVGLDTALVAADDSDREKLRVGKHQLARAFEAGRDERTIVVVLGHHPLQDRWLHDQREVDGYVRRFADVHLSGHIHDHESESILGGGESGLVRVSAGAIHGHVGPDMSPSHGYNVAAAVRSRDGALCLRVYPRRFSPKNRDYRPDVEATAQGSTFAQHVLRRIQQLT